MRIVWGFVVLALAAALWAGRHRIARWLELGGGMALVILLGACGAVSPLAPAAGVANAAGELGATAHPLIEGHCTAPMAALADEVEAAIATARARELAAHASQLQADLSAARQAGQHVDALLEEARRLAAICDPIVLAYDVLRTAHVALRAGIVVASATGDLAGLGPLVADLARAAGEIVDDIERLRRTKKGL